MFPDLTRDDVFTLETRRLWLRWPRSSDVPAIRRIAGSAQVAGDAGGPRPMPTHDAEAYVLAARAANAEGRELALAITLKTTREAVGLISASLEDGGVDIGFALAPAHWGKGLGTEAAHAVIDATFALTSVNELGTDVRADNAASRDVLEKCGFVGVGASVADDCLRYRLTRHDWGALRDRRILPMSQQHGAGRVPTPTTQEAWA